MTRLSSDSYQHAILGDIPFDLITYFSGVEEKYAAEFAEHALIEGKPRLQWTGNKLDEQSWSIVLHAGFCDPNHELQKLKGVLARHEALPLIYANGDYKGWFVPTELSITSHQTMRDGTIVWIDAKLTLREYVVPKVLVEQAPRKNAEAAEKPEAKGGKKKPVKTVKKTPSARAVNASVCRSAS